MNCLHKSLKKLGYNQRAPTNHYIFLQAPLYHLALEVVLTVWIIFLIFFKSYKINDRVPLSEKEQKDLLADWRPEPLVPPLKETQKNAIQYRKVTG